MSLDPKNILRVSLRFSPAVQPLVGRLAVSGRDLAFQYDDAFVASGLSISPLRLPLRSGVQAFARVPGLEVFGVFEDALPDSWGRRIVDRHFQRRLGRPPGILERAAFAGERAMGALTFQPPEEAPMLPAGQLDLAKLAAQAWDFEAEKIDEALPELQRLAGTSGGARPKMLLGFAAPPSRKILPGDGDLPAGFSHWIVKFNSRTDARDAGPLEYAYAEIAARAGADVPAHRLIATASGRFFATRRFDRPGPAQRLHLHSAAGMLHADYRTPGTEYADLFRLTEMLTRDEAQKKELFRRACLNVLACNRDDHLKNFAFLMDSLGRWRLAPLFDFTFHTGPNGWQTLSVAGEGERPGRQQLLKLALEVNLRERDARDIIDEVRAAVAGFYRVAKALKIAARTRERIRKRLKDIDSL